MERRVMATVSVVWPELECIVSSPPFEFLVYPNQEVPMVDVIQIMVGDFQRIIVYAELGFQTPQEIPGIVMSAFNFLVGKGYEKYLV
jgi:hypothetical protein